MVLVGKRRLRRRGTLVQARSGGTAAHATRAPGKCQAFGRKTARAGNSGAGPRWTKKRPGSAVGALYESGLPGGVAFGGQFTTYCHWFSRAARAALSAPIAQ